MIFRILLLVLLVAAACSPSATATPTRAAPTDLPRVSSTDEASFCPPPPNWFVYVTEAGDTLRDLADRTGSSAGELALANCLQNPRAIYAGLVIYVPRQPIMR